MYLAEIHGKLSSRAEKQEDILTSDVFSFFKYSNRSLFLYNFLATVLNLENISEADAEKAIFHFWPTFEDSTEPDLVIRVGDYYLLFEAKIYADFAVETKSTRAQLDRELEEGLKEAQSYGKKFKLVALTRDHIFKPENFSTLPKDKFIWINWQSIAFFLYKILLENNLNQGDRLFIEDLYKVLEKRRLRSFQGLSHLNKDLSLQHNRDKIFYDARSSSYRGAFIGFRQALFFQGRIEPVNKSLFYKKTFFRNMPTNQVSKSPPIIFYERGNNDN